ncbi:MAG: hypothetical protein ACFHWZ_10985 [Phycisphaerales bacterium]
MSPVLSIALKDLRLMLRDRPGLLFTVLFPLLFGLFFGAIYADSATGERRPLAVALTVEAAEDPGWAEDFARALESNPRLDVRRLPDPGATDGALRSGAVLAELRVPAEFGEWFEAVGMRERGAGAPLRTRSARGDRTPARARERGPVRDTAPLVQRAGRDRAEASGAARSCGRGVDSCFGSAESSRGGGGDPVAAGECRGRSGCGSGDRGPRGLARAGRRSASQLLRDHVPPGDHVGGARVRGDVCSESGRRGAQPAR